MTKAVVSTAFMMLYEEGHFQLNDPVYWYLPEFKTPRMTLDPTEGKEEIQEPAKDQFGYSPVEPYVWVSHGLGASQLDQDYMKAMYMQQPVTIAERVQAMASLPLIGHPGEQWYCNITRVLSRLVEHFSGMTTADFLQERLFDLLVWRIRVIMWTKQT